MIGALILGAAKIILFCVILFVCMLFGMSVQYSGFDKADSGVKGWFGLLVVLVAMHAVLHLL